MYNIKNIFKNKENNLKKKLSVIKKNTVIDY